MELSLTESQIEEEFLQYEKDIQKEIEKRHEEINEKFSQEFTNFICQYDDSSDVRACTSFLNHISSCNDNTCCCRERLLYCEENLRKVVGHDIDVLAVAFLKHAGECNHCNACNIQFGGRVIHFCRHLNRTISRVLQESTSNQEYFNAQVLYSDTSWFSKGDQISIPLHFYVAIEYTTNDAASKYSWVLNHQLENAVVTVNKVAPNLDETFEYSLLRIAYVDSPHIWLPQLILQKDNTQYIQNNPQYIQYRPREDCSLREYLNELRLAGIQLDLTVVLFFIHQLISALSDLHQNYIAHNNVSSSNIVLANNCQDLKLIDFRHVRRAIILPQDFNGYLPPANSEADFLLGAADDVFNLGIVIGELLFYQQLDLIHIPEEGSYCGIIKEYVRKSSYSPSLKNMVLQCLQTNFIERPTINELYSDYFAEHSSLQILKKDVMFAKSFRSSSFGAEKYRELERVVVHRGLICCMNSVANRSLPPRQITELERLLEFLTA